MFPINDVSRKPLANGLWSIFNCVTWSFWYAVTAMNAVSLNKYSFLSICSWFSLKAVIFNLISYLCIELSTTYKMKMVLFWVRSNEINWSFFPLAYFTGNYHLISCFSFLTLYLGSIHLFLFLSCKVLINHCYHVLINRLKVLYHRKRHIKKRKCVRVTSNLHKIVAYSRQYFLPKNSTFRWKWLSLFSKFCFLKCTYY